MNTYQIDTFTPNHRYSFRVKATTKAAALKLLLVTYGISWAQVVRIETLTD